VKKKQKNEKTFAEMQKPKMTELLKNPEDDAWEKEFKKKHQKTK